MDSTWFISQNKGELCSFTSRFREEVTDIYANERMIVWAVKGAFNKKELDHFEHFQVHKLVCHL